MAYKTPITIKETLERIGSNEYLLPAIQRELVWAQEPERMTRLFDSILRGYPIGTFLFWSVPPEQSQQFTFYEFMRDWHQLNHRHNDRVFLSQPRALTAILDGQQRLSTLNIGLHGSLAHKLSGRRATSLEAYPHKYLYVDLLYEPGEDDDIQYSFAFLTLAQVEAAPETLHWYRVSEVLHLTDNGPAIFAYIQQHGLTSQRAFHVLNRLWRSVHEDPAINYFEEREQSLSRVLDIFVRVNSGGVQLTKSDLLLSIATAQFTDRDAREQIHSLVDELNATWPGFRFTKDLALKTGLVLTDIGNINFAVENFTAINMATLDQKWDDVDRALRIAVKLIASFGFSESTLSADSVLIPIADYVYTRKLDDTFVYSTDENVRADRAVIRHWMIRALLKPGIWGSSLNQVLRALHQIIRDSHDRFPVEDIEAELARRGKSLTFDAELIEDLLDTPYRSKRTFALLTLLYNWIDVRSEFHVNHIFPRSLATRAKQRDQGIPESQWEKIADQVERLANLQLLPGADSAKKQAQLPLEWVRARFPDQQARDAWLAGHDLYDLPPALADFPTFYEIRRATMRERLRHLLGVQASEIRSSAEEPPALHFSDPVAQAVAHVPRTRRRPADPQTGSRAFYGRAEVLGEMLDSGLLEVGMRLHGFYRGDQYHAEIGPGGFLRWQGRTFDSPTQAAIRLTAQRSVNGWTFWKLPDGTPIGELRSRV